MERPSHGLQRTKFDKDQQERLAEEYQTEEKQMRQNRAENAALPRFSASKSNGVFYNESDK